jgi:aquaporin Z
LRQRGACGCVPQLGIGFVGVSLAFGLTVLTMAYAVGGISGGHFNPAVSLGLAIADRFEWRELGQYWAAQVIGGLAGATVLYAIASGAPNFDVGGFASNGYGELSPGRYGMMSALVAEIVLTAGFLIIILGSTSRAAPAGFAPLAIGLGLTLIHLISIPVTTRRSIRRGQPLWRSSRRRERWGSFGCFGLRLWSVPHWAP